MSAPRLGDAGGRYSKLTPERSEAILTAVEQGSYLKIAALAVGVHEATLYRWLANGATAQTRADQGEHLTPDEETYRQFRESVTRAQARAETTLVAAWQAAAFGPDGDWRAARDMLARTAPERWAGVTRIQMTNEETERRLDDAVTEALLLLGLDRSDPDTDDDDLPRETPEEPA
jgi:transposase-like protein